MKEYTLKTDSPVLRYFADLCRIPHGSGNTAGIADYLMRFAAKNGLDAVRDDTGNVLIRKAGQGAQAEKAPVLLQAHMDMVCISEKGVDFDFTKDPLDICEEDGVIHARGTTLGADDGIGESFMLAVLSAQEIPHPPLECLFTVDEETGMDGAIGLDGSMIRSRRLINLDSDDEGVFITGCAGGARVLTEFPVTREDAAGSAYRLSVEGLAGGHSGGDIDRPVANAIKLLVRILHDASSFSFRLVSAEGGEKQNAIPTDAYAVMLLPEEEAEAFRLFVSREEEILRKEYAGSEERMRVCFAKENGFSCRPLSEKSERAVLDFLLFAPHGIEKWSGTIEATVETSVNLAILRTEEDRVTVQFLARSAVNSARDFLTERIMLLAETFGGSASLDGAYPAWEYSPSSPLLEEMKRVYRECYGGQECRVLVTHGGLECGLFTEKIPGLDIVSAGPDLKDIHTPSERVSAASVGRVYGFLVRVLSELS